jgi:hypothetical protein
VTAPESTPERGRTDECQEWGDSGVESQEVCPACGHYALFHSFLHPCNACTDEQGQRIADAVRAHQSADAAKIKNAQIVAGLYADEDRVPEAIDDLLGIIARLSMPRENAEVGRCGEQAPRFFADQHTTFCCLPHGHPGWHKGDDGAEWTESDQEADHA